MSLSPLSDEYDSKLRQRQEYEARLMRGLPRLANAPSYRCVADPEESFTGSYFYEKQLHTAIELGSMPAASLWINDHTRQVSEIVKMASGEQRLVVVGKKRLRLLAARFPRLLRAIDNPGVM